MRRLPPLRGPWATAWAVVASPWTTWALGWWVAVAAVIGLASPPGGHPAEGLALQLPAALLPLTLAARALAEERRTLWIAAAWCLGLAVAIGGATLAGGAAGVAEVGGARPTESYTRRLDGRAVEAHLGGQLTAALTAEGAALRLGVRDQIMGEAVLPLDGQAEAALGPWAVWLEDVAPGDEPAVARLRLTPRVGGEAVELRVRTGSGAALPDGTSVMVTRLSADFGRALGPAAQVQLDGPGGVVQAWQFVDAPDLDARIGRGDWAVTLLAVETEPRLTLGVRRRGDSTVALAGLGLMVLALGAAVGGRR